MYDGFSSNVVTVITHRLANTRMRELKIVAAIVLIDARHDRMHQPECAFELGRREILRPCLLYRLPQLLEILWPPPIDTGLQHASNFL